MQDRKFWASVAPDHLSIPEKKLMECCIALRVRKGLGYYTSRYPSRSAQNYVPTLITKGLQLQKQSTTLTRIGTTINVLQEHVLKASLLTR
jgi:hypothetical protein